MKPAVKRSAVPVTMGSPRFRSVDTGRCLATEAWFPPHAELPSHTHDRSIFAVMLRGGFRSRIAGRSLQCDPSSIWTEPCEERHSNHVGAEGALVLVVQPDPAEAGMFEPFQRLTSEVQFLADAGVAADARRVLREIQVGDSLTPLGVDGLVMAMMTTASRLRLTAKTHSSPPHWLLRARDMVHARFREGIRLADIAREAGVHPSHLAHSFRTHFGVPVAAYARALRLQWAIERLADPTLAIADIAASAGFSDQSHLTRECRRSLGVSPAEYRRSGGSGKGGSGA